jgi:uncharacterized lipoprotein YmbA
MRTRGWLLWGLTVWTILCSTGCAMVRPRPEVHYYALQLTLLGESSGAGRASLVVRPFNAQDPYDQQRIVYRSSPYVVDFYRYHRWAASPAHQVTDWTRRYLRQVGLFAKVFPSADTDADLTLSGRIQQFEEVDQNDVWQAVLSIDIWLERHGRDSPLWFQSYTATQEATKRNPEAVAEAMSRSLEDILARLVSDLRPVVNELFP